MSDLAVRIPGKELRPGVFQHDFTSAGELLQALHPLGGFWHPGEKWIFRGHADADWLLLPTAHRSKPWHALTSINAKSFDPTRANEMTRARREMQLVQEFFAAVDESGLNVPDFAQLKDLLDPRLRRRRSREQTTQGNTYWPDLELVPILALAQHYGLPTRLLDWSRLGRVGAYFAAQPADESVEKLAVWALQVPDAFPELRLSSGQAEWHVVTAPRSSNPNLHAQAGLFTLCHWWTDELAALDELVSRALQNFKNMTKQHDAEACFMRKLVLPRHHAKDLMRLLHIDGVSALTAFPGFAGEACRRTDLVRTGGTATGGRLMHPPPVPVHADFCTDLRVHVLHLLTELGVSLPPADQNDAHRVCIAYFNVGHKRVEPRRRTLHWSRELARKTLPDAVRVGVQLIEVRSVAGDSLEPHFSERATLAHTHDWLLNDWGIHHLHVHPNRGADLLYMLVEPDDMYLLDVRGHNAMADVDLLEIVLANWPALLTPIPGLRGPRDGKNPTAEELQSARRSGVQPLLTLSDGQVYAHRGGGLTTARGSSTYAVSETDFEIQDAWALESRCREMSGGIAQDLGLNELHLIYNPAARTVTETKTGHCWPTR